MASGRGGTYIASSSQIKTGAAAKNFSSTLTTGNATTITVSNIDLDTDGQYIIRYFIKATVGQTVRLYVNGDTTNTNYYSTRIYHAGNSTMNNVCVNDACIASIDQKDCYGEIRICKTAGLAVKAHTEQTTMDSTATRSVFNAYSWSYVANTNNVTSVSLTSDSANGLLAGSTIQVWKM